MLLWVNVTRFRSMVCYVCDAVAGVGTLLAIKISMKTTIAIAIWENGVSTTFDFAEKLLVVETEAGREIERREVVLAGKSVEAKVTELKESGGVVLLCGAVSRSLAWAVNQAGIQVIPFVTGDVDDVLAAYMCGQLDRPRFLQAGCQAGARRRWRNGRKHLGGIGNSKRNERRH